jgi:hypothetical protein
MGTDGYFPIATRRLSRDRSKKHGNLREVRSTAVQGLVEYSGLRSQLRFDLHKVGVFQPGPIRSSAKSLAVGTEGALEAGRKKLPTPISVNYINSRFDVML